MQVKRNIIFLLVSIFITDSYCCNCDQGIHSQEKTLTLINTSHLDHLYQDVTNDGKLFGIVHIYSEYPDYKWVGDEDEGIACVDDATRAAIFYMRYSEKYNDKECNRKAKNLIEFLLYMQAENGYFYNFIMPDFSINKTYKTSVAEPNWWSWRAMWCLTEAYEFFKNDDKLFTQRIEQSLAKIVTAAKSNFTSAKTTIDLNGFKRPTWLPFQFAADQAALIVISLSNYYKSSNDSSVLQLINDFLEGILLMQEGNAQNFPHYTIMSWENSWHAWGNAQSYSLLKGYEVIKNKKYLKAALNELNNFYGYLIEKKFVSEFSIKQLNGKTILDSEKKYSQIAYGIRPMVFAAIKAAEITKDQKYYRLAAEISAWFFGKNAADAEMYSSQNGRCFDGIISEKEVNKNSGAESTIEALLSLLAIESNPTAKNILNELIKNKSLN